MLFWSNPSANRELNLWKCYPRRPFFVLLIILNVDFRVRLSVTRIVPTGLWFCCAWTLSRMLLTAAGFCAYVHTRPPKVVQTAHSRRVHELDCKREDEYCWESNQSRLKKQRCRPVPPVQPFFKCRAICPFSLGANRAFSSRTKCSLSYWGFAVAISTCTY